MIQLDKTDQNNHFSTLEINKRYVKKKKMEMIQEKLPIKRGRAEEGERGRGGGGRKEGESSEAREQKMLTAWGLTLSHSPWAPRLRQQPGPLGCSQKIYLESLS